MSLVDDIKDLTGIEYSAARVLALSADLSVMAEECLDQLSEQKQKLAIKYLVAHFLTLQGVNDGKGQMQSESLGDASWTYWTYDKGAGSNATDFGRLARKIAPCLGDIMGDKLYGAIRLIR